MLTEAKLYVLEQLDSDIDGFCFITPSVRESIACWILEDREDTAEKIVEHLTPGMEELHNRLTILQLEIRKRIKEAKL